MPNVYSPEGVSWRLRNSPDSAASAAAAPRRIRKAAGTIVRDIVDLLARQRISDRRGRIQVEPQDRLVAVLDQPDRAIGGDGHADGCAARSHAVDLIPLRDQLVERRGGNLRLLLGAEHLGGRATHLVA